jgi:hypothetical protein
MPHTKNFGFPLSNHTKGMKVATEFLRCRRLLDTCAGKVQIHHPRNSLRLNDPSK